MIIEAKNATKKFGQMVAVDGASFAVKQGEVVGFVGANGAGKSTMINMLLGFISPTEGEVALFDDRVELAQAHRPHAAIGYAAGDMALPDSLTAAQYFDFVAHQYGADVSVRQGELIKRFSPELHKKIRELSRGNKQKIALIAAFLASPKLVILDEPTSGLDPLMQERFLELVREEQAKGTTIFMSSHYLGEVADVCTRVLLMREGAIIDDVSAKELLSRGGKMIRIVTGYTRTAAPRGAEAVTRDEVDGKLVLEFNWKHDAAKLQTWLAGVKQLHDVEISEYSLETAFAGLYETEGKVAA